MDVVGFFAIRLLTRVSAITRRCYWISSGRFVALSLASQWMTNFDSVFCHFPRFCILLMNVSLNPSCTIQHSLRECGQRQFLFRNLQRGYLNVAMATAIARAGLKLSVGALNNAHLALNFRRFAFRCLHSS